MTDIGQGSETQDGKGIQTKEEQGIATELDQTQEASLEGTETLEEERDGRETNPIVPETLTTDETVEVDQNRGVEFTCTHGVE